MSIRFRSTNRRSPSVTFRQAVMEGQAPDWGLYVPETIPVLSPGIVASFRNRPYDQVAAEVMLPFVADDISPEDLAAVCADAYSFEVPIEQVGDGFYLLYLDRGPTASFKDFAARASSPVATASPLRCWLPHRGTPAARSPTRSTGWRVFPSWCCFQLRR